MNDATTDDLLLLTRSLSTISTILQRGQRRALDPTRFGLFQLAMERQAIRPSDVAKELQVSASSVTRAAQALQDEGKIVMIDNPTDRRGYLISLTDEGREELLEVERRGVEFFRAELAEWDSDKVHILGLLLARLVETLASRHEQRRQEREASGQLGV